MARYQMADGTVTDTKKAIDSWQEKTCWDGRDELSRATGSQWFHQKLYRSPEGRYYLVHTSQLQDPHAAWLSPEEAARWLMLNERPLPDDLVHYAGDLPSTVS